MFEVSKIVLYIVKEHSSNAHDGSQIWMTLCL